MVGCDEIIIERSGQLTGPQDATTTESPRILELEDRSLLTTLEDIVCNKTFCFIRDNRCQTCIGIETWWQVENVDCS